MTRVAILWHMHQPFYEDRATGEHILPWVRLHTIKDYWGMAALLREFPGVRVTFNLVPSLLVQIQAFAEDRAQDRHLAIGLKPADILTPTERTFLVANAFHSPFERMIKPQPRYAELYHRRRQPESFTAADLRDLQVLHKLTWMDPDWSKRDRRLLNLVAKQRLYSEDDKQVLRQVELEILRAVIPEYRELASIGRIELSTSPFYHPILPLLCDSDVHLRAHPHSALPRQLFARPEDATEQLNRALGLHESLFGSPPSGIWPSEGSLSDAVLGLLADRPTTLWTATDEEILARTLQRPVAADDLYRPYEIGADGHTVRCLFRDHSLSDLVGFAYQGWEAEAAADDFVTKIRAAGRRFAASPNSKSDGGEVATVSVILDGENAWEHYVDGGRPFLRAVYRKLQNATDLETVTMSAATAGPARRLTSIFPGSWINADFYIWAGHADDHRAWRQLAEARAVFDEHAAKVEAGQRAKAWEEILIAEGSDWFWWYGDDHSSDHDRVFDDLFRRHLRNIYRALDRPAPNDLHVPNISTERAAAGPIRFQSIAPARRSGSAFVDWVGAVTVPLGGAGGTMHRVAGQLVQSLEVTANRLAVFFRLEGPDLIMRLNAGDFGLAVLVHRPSSKRLELSYGSDSGPRWVLSEVVEIVAPFADLAVQANDRVRLAVLVTDRAGHVIEQHPGDYPLEFVVPTRHLDAMNWRV